MPSTVNASTPFDSIRVRLQQELNLVQRQVAQVSLTELRRDVARRAGVVRLAGRVVSAVGDDDVEHIAEDVVVAGAADHAVAAEAGLDVIVAAAAKERVVAVLAEQRVAFRTTLNAVVPRAAVEQVVPFVAGQRVVAVVAQQCVVAVVGRERDPASLLSCQTVRLSGCQAARLGQGPFPRPG